MRKFQLLSKLFLAAFVGAFLVSASPAFAVKQFYDEFKEVYVNNGKLDAGAVAAGSGSRDNRALGCHPALPIAAAAPVPKLSVQLHGFRRDDGVDRRR